MVKGWRRRSATTSIKVWRRRSRTTSTSRTSATASASSKQKPSKPWRRRSTRANTRERTSTVPAPNRIVVTRLSRRSVDGERGPRGGAHGAGDGRAVHIGGGFVLCGSGGRSNAPLHDRSQQRPHHHEPKGTLSNEEHTTTSLRARPHAFTFTYSFLPP